MTSVSSKALIAVLIASAFLAGMWVVSPGQKAVAEAVPVQGAGNVEEAARIQVAGSIALKVYGGNQSISETQAREVARSVRQYIELIRDGKGYPRVANQTAKLTFECDC